LADSERCQTHSISLHLRYHCAQQFGLLGGGGINLLI
jgi:hypothetical protein